MLYLESRNNVSKWGLGVKLVFLAHQHFRFLTSKVSYTEDEVSNAKKWLKEFTPDNIPTSIFNISYSRSSGAGGQKVNKTSSKATVSLAPHQWLNPKDCHWIPSPIRSQLEIKKLRFETKSGGLIIQSDLSRSREINTSDCFLKLLHEIKDNTFFNGETSEEDRKRWEEIKQDKKEKRLFHKKKKSEKKRSRSKRFEI